LRGRRRVACFGVGKDAIREFHKWNVTISDLDCR
jgi:hypothetical protein